MSPFWFVSTIENRGKKADLGDHRYYTRSCVEMLSERSRHHLDAVSNSQRRRGR